ncbi:MAG: hypothetical protein SOZ17_05595 [Agathobacter sp.]|nr:hypothetical protein [Agathobacter sp.]
MGGNSNRKKRPKVLLALFLVMVMAITGIPLKEAMVVRAEGTEPIRDIEIKAQTTVGELNEVFGDDSSSINEDGSITIENVTVRSGHFIVIWDARVHINNLTLESGARIEILSTQEGEAEPVFGKLTYGTLTVGDGAQMMLSAKANAPEGITLYQENMEGRIIQCEGEFDWKEFTYRQTEERWIAYLSEYDRFGSTEGKEILVEVEICDYPGGEALPFVLPEGFAPEDFISDGNRVKLRVPRTTGSVDLGWIDAAKPVRIAVDNNSGEERDNWIFATDEQMVGGKYTLQLNLMNGEQPREYYFVQFLYGPEGGGAGDPQESEKVRMLREGLKRLNEEQGVAYHAYGNQVYSDETITNANDSENTSEDDLRLGWAKYLARDFAVGEGRYQGIGEAIGLAANTEENKRSNDEKVLRMITCAAQSDEYKIAAKDRSGANHELSAYTLTFKPILVADKFSEEERQELEAMKVTTTAYMIQKEDVSSGNTYSQVVIKVGNEFYIRNAADGENEEYKCLGSGNNDNTRALNIVTDQLNGSESVVVFGNNASLSSEKLSDDSAKEYFVNNFNSNENGVGMGGKVAIYRPTFTGVFLKPDSETNKEAWAWETNTSYDIKESGEKSETDFYFGYGKAIISPLTEESLTGIPVKELTKVEVLGGIPENAVKVVKNADKTFTLEFLSDFYDQVQLQLTYLMNDETEKQNTLTINRVGIVLQYGRTPGDDKTRVQIYHGHQSGEFISNDGKEMGGVIYATYYHPQGTGNIESSDTSLYVTLHYRDGRTEQRIIKASFFKEEDSGHTAMSDYVIAIAPQEGNLEDLLPTYVEAIAVENADASGRFNGAKLGAGKGVHCDVVFDE